MLRAERFMTMGVVIDNRVNWTEIVNTALNNKGNFEDLKIEESIVEETGAKLGRITLHVVNGVNPNGIKEMFRNLGVAWIY